MVISDDTPLKSDAKDVIVIDDTPLKTSLCRMNVYWGLNNENNKRDNFCFINSFLQATYALRCALGGIPLFSGMPNKLIIDAFMNDMNDSSMDPNASHTTQETSFMNAQTGKKKTYLEEALPLMYDQKGIFQKNAKLIILGIAGMSTTLEQEDPGEMFHKLFSDVRFFKFNLIFRRYCKVTSFNILLYFVLYIITLYYNVISLVNAMEDQTKRMSMTL